MVKITLLLLCCPFLVFGVSNDTIPASNENNFTISSNFIDQVPGIPVSIFFTQEYNNAIEKVNELNFNSGFINNPLGLIEGRVAGLSIVKAGGNPNRNYDARIRGLSTIYGNTMPTIIIDGVIDAQLENIDPNDIDSFEVIKDAAGTAFYGIRGANGVIIIQTKKGGDYKTKVNYNNYVNAENSIRRQQNLSTSEWRSFSNTMGMGTDFLSNTNWYDEVLQTGWSNVHNLSISGGSPDTKYYVSMNYRNINGTILSSGFQRFNTRMNLSHKALNDKLTLVFGFGSTWEKAQLINDNINKYAASYNPTAPVKSNDAAYSEFGGYFQQYYYDFVNPVSLLEESNDQGQQRINTSLNASYQFNDHFELVTRYALQYFDQLGGRYIPKTSFGNSSNNGYAIRSEQLSSNQLFETDVHYKNKLSLLDYEVQAGYSYQYFNDEGFSVEGGDFITDAFTYNNLAAAKDFTEGLGIVNSYKNTQTIVGFYGKMNFEWNNRYFLSFVSRYDGSSRFGKNQKWGFYPGISAGVELEDWLNINKIDQLKLRVGWGRSGNNLYADHLSISQIEPTGGYYYYNGEFERSYGIFDEANPDLKAETKSEINIGVDFKLINDKLFGSFDYYSNHINDVLWFYNIPSPPNLGYGKWFNIGELKNEGVELSLFYDAVKVQDFSYTPGIALTWYLKNKLGSFSDPVQGLNFGTRYYNSFHSSVLMNIVEEYSDVGNFWGLIYNGISADGEFVYKDLDANGYTDNNDNTVIGNGMPNMELGFSNQFQYKSWDLSLFFKGVFGQDLVNIYRLIYENTQSMYAYNIPKSTLQLKTTDGQYVRDYQNFSDRLVEKGNYFKLANFSLGYNFQFNESSAIKKMRVYFMGNNLFVITGFSGSDPELRYGYRHFYYVDEYNPLTPGINNEQDWLMTRSFSMGLNIGF